MAAPHPRRLVASLAVVALLAGTAPLAPRGTVRCHCTPGCPMHATSHGAGRLPCHGGGAGLRGTCGHGAGAAAPATGVRIALAAAVGSLPALVTRSVAPAGASAHAAPAAEPPTDPPRASLA